MRATLLDLLQFLGDEYKGGLHLPDVDVDFRKSPVRAVVASAAELPDEYVTVETVRGPKLAAIKADLEQGVVIPGASLSNAQPVLVVRTK
jgi:hypothetical protein